MKAEFASVSIQSVKAQDSIAGYALKERIGSGGFGEVWRAEAPGGIQKAIKLVYGFHEENRARDELKSLERIKELRHPFLLSLERIEVVDGRLVVVTELADSSLKEVFDRHVSEGETGVPRAELLKYLRDAADALDYIREEHGLQHLDIKPENLLVVGGHMKVADFGLVKEIEATNLSMMSGMTPMYAAPELFDGRPSSSSDQYSLAVVYYEMLTGRRPFGGATPAQLAHQHIHVKPDVSHLPRGDQGPVGVALRKDPTERYPDSRTLIEELSNREARRQRPATVPTMKRTRPRKGSSHGTCVLTPNTLQKIVPNPEVRRCSAIQAADPVPRTRPVICITIGATGTRVAQQFKRCVTDRVGPLETVPAVKILCLDTDERNLVGVLSSEPGSLTFSEVMPLPLRKPEDYRSEPPERFQWLSRRWIYNVPRTLQTEGLRPLGRLAFADHHAKLFERLHDLVEEVSTPEAIARTAVTTEMEPTNLPPLVFVVAAVSGGVGSGMTADVAMAVKTVLREQGLSDQHVHAILLHTGGATPSAKSLAVANTLSCLGELNHYHIFGYPGDETCNLPPCDGDDTTPFRRIRVIDIGDDLLHDEYQRAVDSIAEYLFLSAMTPFGESVDRCQTPADSVEDCVLRLGTFGVSQSGTLAGGIAAGPTARVAFELTSKWTEELSEVELAADAAISRVANESRLTLPELVGDIEQELRRKTETTPREFIDRIVQRWIDDNPQPVGNGAADQLVRLVEQALGEGARLQTAKQCESLRSMIDRWMFDRSVAISGDLKAVISDSLNTPGARVTRAERELATITERLRRMQDEVDHLLTAQRHVAQQMVQEIAGYGGRGRRSEGTASIGENATQYALWRLQEFLLANAKRIITDVSAGVADRGSLIQSIRQGLMTLQTQFEIQVRDLQSEQSTQFLEGDRLLASMTLDYVSERTTKLVEDSDQTLQTDAFLPAGGVSGFVESDPHGWEQRLRRVLLRVCRTFVRQSLRNVDFDELLGSSNVSEEQLLEWANNQIDAAVPRLLSRCGGDAYLYLAVPRNGASHRIPESLERAFGQPSATIPATTSDVTVCCEGAAIPIAQLALQLVSEDPKATELIPRLHVRNDVDWTPLLRSGQ